MEAITGNLSALKSDLRDFYDDYAFAIDRNDLKAWVSFFTEDALYRVISRESYSQGLTHATIYCDSGAMIRDRATLIEQVAVYEPRTLRHFISGVRVQSSSAEKIEATASFLIIESLFDAEPQIFMVGEYVDEFVVTEAGLRLRSRSAVYDQYRVRTTLVFPV
jgi:anthranilate 1,2-dioxygenase small subunit